tara:strand:- start:792 stop:1118 length:327 start_codon:yes stop_codon:yes gene_type:complete
MYQTINFYDFERAFINSRRENQFTHLAKQELFNWLECLEDDQGKPIELDIISLCCEFTEFESIQEFQQQYGEQYKTFEDIEYDTLLIPVKVEYSSKGCQIISFIIQNF